MTKEEVDQKNEDMCNAHADGYKEGYRQAMKNLAEAKIDGVDGRILWQYDDGDPSVGLEPSEWFELEQTEPVNVKSVLESFLTKILQEPGAFELLLLRTGQEHMRLQCPPARPDSRLERMTWCINNMLPGYGLQEALQKINDEWEDGVWNHEEE